MVRQPVINLKVMKNLFYLLSTGILFMLFNCHTSQPKEASNHNMHNQGHKHQHEWNMSTEEMVKEFNDPERDLWQKPFDVIALFGNIEHKTIMDLGAGAGYFSFKLAEKGANVIAADLQQGYLDFIDKTSKTIDLPGSINTKLVSASSAKLSKNEVDGILMVHVYHHIENRVDYFTEICKHLNPGSKLLILETPPSRCPDAPPPAHFRLTFDQIKEELSAAGFQQFQMDSSLLECQVAYLVSK
jgi:SAM-dependent methyltransferase